MPTRRGEAGDVVCANLLSSIWMVRVGEFVDRAGSKALIGATESRAAMGRRAHSASASRTPPSPHAMSRGWIVLSCCRCTACGTGATGLTRAGGGPSSCTVARTQQWITGPRSREVEISIRYYGCVAFPLHEDPERCRALLSMRPQPRFIGSDPAIRFLHTNRARLVPQKRPFDRTENKRTQRE